MNLYNLGAWVILSGSLFTLFSYFANQYHKQHRTSVQFIQDFIGGALFMSFIAVLIPDYFPDIFKLLLIPTGPMSAMTAASEDLSSSSDLSQSLPDNPPVTNSTSLISLLPKIGGFMDSMVTSKNTDDIQLQLGPIPSGSLGGRY
jgi:hypothetical protein